MTDRAHNAANHHVPAAARKVDQHFTIKAEVNEYDFSPGAGMLRLSRHETSFGEWWTGDFVDYRGVVSIQRDGGNNAFLRLDMVAGGYCRTRSWRGWVGDRTLAKLCRAFLTDFHGAPE